MTVDLLWREASRDIDAEMARMDVLMAKQATAHLWTFLALARSNEEFDHRLAMITPEVEERVAAHNYDAVIEGFRENFRLAGHAEENEAPLDAGPLQIWHHASQQWVTAASSPPTGNPAYFSGGPELGPNTSQTGNYPVETAGPDPWNPMNGNVPLPPSTIVPPANRFPAEPQPWTIPPDKAWVENPMQFQTGPGTQYRQGAQAPMQPNTPNPGWQQNGNPYYFGQGQEGIASQDGRFPQDISLPEPDERLDLYQTGPTMTAPLPPSSSPEFAGPPVQTVQYPNYVTGAHEARTNVGACAADGCGRPVYRQGKKWFHLDPYMQNDHRVLLDEQHPYIQQQRSALRHTAPGGGEHAPYKIKKVDGGYAVFNEKGERKNDDPKSYGGARNYQKALYKNVPGAKESAEEDEGHKSAMFFDPHFAAEQQQPMSVPGGSGAGAAPAPSTPKPPAPPSMHPGGPGAQAMPPLAPGHPASNVPQPGAPPGGATSAPNTVTPKPGGNNVAQAALDPAVAIFFRQADEGQVRERPSIQNPSGIPDEYTERTWEGPANTRPRQSAEDRGVNTPQRPQEPIPQISSDTMPQREEEEEDER